MTAEPTGGAPAQGAGTPKAQGADATAQGANPDAQGAAGDQGGGVEDVSALRAKLIELERDNREYRKALKAQADADKAKQTEGQTEAERLSTKVAELERQLADRTQREQEQALRYAAITAATRLGFRNPEVAYRLIDPSAVEYGEDGTPRNVDALLTALAKSDSYLITSTDFGGGVRGSSPATQQPGMNEIIRAAAKQRS